MSQQGFINYDYIRRFDAAAFRDQQPFPSVACNQFLTTQGFHVLLQDFPGMEWFEKHENMPRGDYQRPHNRYYLAYEESIYHPHDNIAPGIVKHEDLPLCWQLFIDELRGDEYRNFIKVLLGASNFTVRFAWHIGVSGSEVSPHRDLGKKVGTHILYFNTSRDWAMEWGGATLVLGGKRTPSMNPEFENFDTAVSIPLLDNRSFIFKNTPNAWHGMRKLNSPEGKQRRLFNVIFEVPSGPAEKSHVFRLPPLLRRVLSRF